MTAMTAGLVVLRPRATYRTGFSLIEMIVVVAIIMVLAAVLLPVFESALGSAESTSCLSNLHHLGMAALLYADDHDTRLVAATLPGPTAGGTCWDVTLQPYLTNTLILLCPTDESPRRLPQAVCEPHSYGINLAIAQVGGYLGSSMCLVNIRRPASTILFCELNGERYATNGVDYDAGGLERVAIRRHGNGSNYSFVDGHTKWLLPERTEDPENLWRP